MGDRAVKLIPTMIIEPCPFCGSKTTVDQIDWGKKWAVGCENDEKCWASGPQKRTIKSAVNAWNKVVKKLNKKD